LQKGEGRGILHGRVLPLTAAGRYYGQYIIFLLVFRPSRYLSRVMGIGPVQRQSLISLTSTLGLTALGLVSTMYFAHVLGPAVLGAYFLFLAYFGIFNIIGDGGLGGAAVKRISEGRDQNEFFGAFLLLRIGLLAVSVAVLLALRPFLVDLTSSEVYLWLLLALVVSVIATWSSYGVYGSGKVGIHQISGLFNNTARIIVQVVAVFLGFGAAGLMGGFVAGMIAGSLLNLRFLELRPARFGRRHVASLLAFSFWIFLSSGGIVIFTYADTVLIGYFLTEADVGIYRVAFLLTSVATFTATSLHITLFPRISHWGAHSDLRSVETALARAFTYSLLLAVPVCFGGWILGDRILYFFYGASFVSGAPALNILLAMQVAHVFMYLQTMSLNALDRPRVSFQVTAVASVINIALNLILIPAVGIVGAAVATLATMVVNAGLAYRSLSRILPVRIERSAVGHILLAASVMALVTALFRLLVPLTSIVWVIAAVALGALIYGFMLLNTDRDIHDELRDLALKLGIPWPSWL